MSCSWSSWASFWVSGSGAWPSMPCRNLRTAAAICSRPEARRTTRTAPRSITHAKVPLRLTRYSTSVVPSGSSACTSATFTGSTDISEACSTLSLRTRSRKSR